MPDGMAHRRDSTRFAASDSPAEIRLAACPRGAGHYSDRHGLSFSPMRVTGSWEQELRHVQEALWSRADIGRVEGVRTEVGLNEVFIELHVVEGEPRKGDTFDIEERRALALLHANPADEVAQRRADLTQLERLQRRAAGREPLAARLARTPSLVLLGDPGCGKSTALRHHLLTLLRDPQGSLPLLVPLAGYDDQLCRAPDANLFNFIEEWVRQQFHLPEIGRSLRDRYFEGGLTLLLDGLDEITQRARRAHVAREVEVLLARKPPGSAVVVSSRFSGYTEALLRGLPVFTVVDLANPEIEGYASRALNAIASCTIPDTTEGAERARSRAAGLSLDLREKPGVRELAGNPMLLRQLVVLSWINGTLPERRISLYRQYLDSLLKDWPHQRSEGARRGALPASDPDLVEATLQELAFELHRSHAHGTARERAVLDLLTGVLRRRGISEPAAQSRQIFDDLRWRAGVLVARAPGSMGFLHLSVQEHLAGRHLAELGPADRWAFLSEHLHRPSWREPLLHMVAWMVHERGEVTGACAQIAEVLDAEGRDESVLHLDLLLAADLAAEVGQHRSGRLREVRAELATRLARLLDDPIPTLRWEVVRRLANLTAAGCTQASTVLADWLARRRDVWAASGMVAVLTRPEARALREHLRAWVSTTDDWNVPRFLAETLAHDDEDLDRLVIWARTRAKRPQSNGFVWPEIARHLQRSQRVRAAVLDELTREGAELVLPYGDAWRDDPELCRALFVAWARKGGHSSEEQARTLGRALIAQGMAPSEMLAHMRAGWADHRRAGHVIPALEACATDPEVRAFLWSAAISEEGDVNGLALVALARDASEAEVERLLEGLATSTDASREAWTGAVLRLSPELLAQARICAALDAVLAGPHISARLAVIRARRATTTDHTLIQWFEAGPQQISTELVPELGRRVSRPDVRAALERGARTGWERGHAKGWAWAPLAKAYAHDERVRLAFDAAVQARNPQACRALALQTDAPEDRRITAVEQLGPHLSTTLEDGGWQLVALVGRSERLREIFASTRRWRHDRRQWVRAALIGLLMANELPDWIDEEVEEDEWPLLLGDLYEYLDEEHRSELDAHWSDPTSWSSTQPPTSVPVVAREVAAGVVKGLPLALSWAHALPTRWIDHERVRGALREACGASEATQRADALRCLTAGAAVEEADLRLLVSGLRDTESRVRVAAMTAILPLDRHDLLDEAVRASLDDDASRVRFLAATWLSAQGLLAPCDRVDWLGIHTQLAWLGDDSPSPETLRRVIAASLAPHVAEDPALRTRLDGYLDSPFWSVRQGAALTLMGATGVEPPIERLLAAVDDDRDGLVSWLQHDCAAALLGAADPEADRLAQELLCGGLLGGLARWQEQRDQQGIRRLCARTLGQNDALLQRTETLKALREALTDPEPEVRSDAWRALRRALTAPVTLEGVG